MRRLAFLLAILSIFTQYAQAQAPIRDGVGLCVFPWLEGTTTQTAPYFQFPTIGKFSTVRVYADLAQANTTPTYAEIDRTVIPNSIGPIAWDHPWHATGWRMDSTYAALSAAGIDVVLCPQGGFSNQKIAQGASKRKHPAIDVGADPNDVFSYWPYAQLYAQAVLRYGPTQNDTLIKWLRAVSGNSYLTEVPKSGLNTIWGFQAGNEDNFPWHGGVVLTGYNSGVKFAACVYNARLASPDARLIMPSFLGATKEYLLDFIEGYKEGCRQLDMAPRYDWYISFHRYHRAGGMGQTQGADTGASAESVQAHLLYESMDSIKELYGIQGILITETGWNDDPRPEGIKQRATEQEGFSLSESVGLLAIRNSLIAQASGIDRVYYYLIRDEYEGQPYTYTGWTFHRWHPTYGSVNSSDPKPMVPLVEAWMDQYGDYTVVKGSYKEAAGIYSVDVTLAGLPIGQLKWTDEKNIGQYTPEPRLFVGDTTPEPDPEPEPPVSEPEYFMIGDTVKVEKIRRGVYVVTRP